MRAAADLPFTKMSAGGNDFIVLAAERAEEIGDLPRWVEEVCARGMSVGADGVLIVGPDDEADARLVHYNADGGRSDLCGNGARCAARWARRHGLGGDPLRLRTDVGILDATFPDADQVRLQLGLSCPRPELRRLALPGGTIESGHFLLVGIPHLVIRVEDCETVDVEGRGRALRWHQEFQPDGTNVSFVAPASRGGLHIRTFERGVEGETLACGTGCCAAAVVAAELGWCEPPVVCHTRSGVALEVGFRDAGEGYEDLTLCGEARIVYEAQLSPEAMALPRPVAPA